MKTVFFGLFLLIVGTAAYAGLRAAPWVPTKKKDVLRFLGLAKIKSGEKFYDLGCGDGRFVSAATRAGADAVGYEISLLPYFLAKLRGLFLRNKNYKILYKDFWKQDLKDADVVYIFLMPDAFEKLKAKFTKELKPGARVISLVWPIKGWEPSQVSKEDGRVSLYLYKM